MSDSDSSEEPVVAPKATVVKKAPIDSDSDSDSVPAKPAPKSKPAPAAANGRPAIESDSDSDSVPPKPAVPKGQAAADDSDSDSDEPPATLKVAPKVKVVEAMSDDSDDDSDAEKPAGKDAGKKAASKKESEEPPAKGKAKLDAAAEKAKQGDAKGSKLKGEDEAEGTRVFISGLPWKVTEDLVRQDFSPCGDIEHVKVLIDPAGRSKGVAFITFKKAEGVQKALKMDGDTKKYKGRTLKISPALKHVKKEDKPKEAKKEKKNKEGKTSSRGSNLPAIELPTVPAGPQDIINNQMIEKLKAAQIRKDWATLENLGAKIVTKAKLVQAERARLQKREDDVKNTVFVSGLPQEDFDEEAFGKRFTDCGAFRYVWLPCNSTGECRGFGKIAFKTEDGFQKALKYDGTKCKGNMLTVVKSTFKKNKVQEAVADVMPKKGKKDKRRETSKEEPAVVEQGSKRKSASTDETVDDAAPKKKKKLQPEEPVEEPPKKHKKVKALEETPVKEEEVVTKKAKKEAK